MSRLKVALRVLAGYLGRGVHEQYLLAPVRRFLAAADEDAGLHGRVEEEVCTESDDCLDEIASHELFAHLRFLVTEEYAVGEEYGAPAALRVHALEDVLDEGIVGSSLRGRAEEVAAIGVGCERLAIPLFDGVGRIGEHHVEGAQLARFEEGGVTQCVVVGDFEVLDAVKEQIHTADGG